jgi:hypothetical protein
MAVQGAWRVFYLDGVMQDADLLNGIEIRSVARVSKPEIQHWHTIN